MAENQLSKPSDCQQIKRLTCACVALTLVWCGALSAEAPTSPTKVGVILPLTGPLAEYGIAMQNGIALARKFSPDLRNNIEFIYEDSRYNPREAVTIFRKFVADRQVKFIMNFGCPTSQALVPLVDRAEVPTAMFCSSLLMTKGRQYSFGMTSPANEWARILSNFLNSRQLKKLCLVLTENDYLVSEYNALKQQVESSGREMSVEVVDRYAPQDTDFRSSALKIKSKGCDALGVYMLPGQVRTFFTQSNRVKLNTQIFGTDIFESKEEILASRKGMEGSVFVNLAVPSTFKDRYSKLYKNENQISIACVTHDLVIRVSRLLNQGESGSELMRKISQLPEQVLGCGSSEFIRSESGEQFMRFPVALKQVVSDRVVEMY